MPLFLKSIAPELDIFGNRQLLNFNKDPSSGESDSALTLINWFTPILNVNANSTLEFLTPAMKGFRFNHSLSTTGTFGNFAFEKYDRFGVATPLWSYDEQTGKLSFAGNDSPYPGITITWMEPSYHLYRQSYIIDNNLDHPAIAHRTVQGIGTNKLRYWEILTHLGDDEEYDTEYSILYANAFTGAYKKYLGISVAGDLIYIATKLNMASHPIINLTAGVNPTDAVNKSQLDSKTWTASQIADFDTQVRTSSLDQMALPISSLNLNNQKIINQLNPTDAQDGATKQYVDINSPTAQSIMHGYLFNTQGANIAIGDHIKFDNSAFTRGTAITLDTSSTYSNAVNTASIGRITLVAGKTYKLTAIACTASFSSATALLGLKWHNNTTNTPLGTVNTWWGGAYNYTSGGAVVAYITTTVSTRVELRINNVSALTQLYGTIDSNSATWFVVEEV